MTEISKIQVGQSSYEIKDEKAARISHTHKTSEITGLSTVATSGNYSDLKGKPSVATETGNGLMSAADKKRLDGIANVKEWVESRGQNLVSNGYATLGNNTNFSSFTFDGADAFQSGGSFSYKTTHLALAFIDELIPYDSSTTYKLSYYIKSDSASAHYYDILDCYDIDGNQITDFQVMFVTGSTTTLTADLKPGDTSVSVKSAAGFNSSDSDGGQYYNRGLMFWNYANSFGYTYPPETYTRNRYDNLWTKNSTAINKTSNRITLDKAWSGPTIPKGTSVSQNERGMSSVYGNMYFTVTANKWTHKECTFENKARPGTAYVKIGWVIPNDLGGASSVTTKLTGVSFGAEYATQASLDSYKATNDKAVAAIAAASAGTLTGATAESAGKKGLVPAPAAGDQGKWLRGDGTWAAVTPSGIGAAASSHEHSAADITTGKLDTERLITVSTAQNVLLCAEAGVGALYVVDANALADVYSIISKMFAPRRSPNLTGEPTAPTASAGTSNTQIATTAFVASAIAAAGGAARAVNTLGSWTVIRITAAYALLLSQVSFTPSGWTEWGRNTQYSNLQPAVSWPVTVKSVIYCDVEVQYDTCNSFCDAYLNALPTTSQFPPFYVTSRSGNTSLETTVTVQRIALVRTA